jgi:DNA-binding GntR family transcriptional regulator
MILGRPIVARSLVDEAFERIANAIVIGEIEPGERLREIHLATQFGVSRGVLREAMQRLEGLKLVRRTSNIGVFAVGLSRDDLFELYTVREALEGMAARMAATNILDDEIKSLQAQLERHGKSMDLQQGDGYFQYVADEDFHVFIARASRNGRLERTLCNEIYFQLRMYRYRSSSHPGRARSAFIEHRDVVDAIVARDPDRAEQAMRTHLRNARENLRWSDDAPDAPAQDKRSAAAAHIDRKRKAASARADTPPSCEF